MVQDEHDNDEGKLRAKLAELEEEFAKSEAEHEVRVAEKTKTLGENIKYYGSKTQELI